MSGLSARIQYPVAADKFAGRGTLRESRHRRLLVGLLDFLGQSTTTDNGLP